jgi:hypothetical protein
MEQQTGRALPGQTVLGVLLLAMSGTLLAVDVGVTGAVQAADRPLSRPADFAIASNSRITGVTTQPAQRLTPPCNLCDGSQSHVRPAAAARSTSLRPMVQISSVKIEPPIVEHFAAARKPPTRLGMNARLKNGRSERSRPENA